MPVLQPAELWKRTGRYDIDELFKLQDRRGAELVLAMTHEENLTFHISREVRSYRDLPRLLYHFQTKERDEPRPRAGVLRTREFIMKDAYSFDRDAAGLDESYGHFIHAYDRIFDRVGLEWYRVEADVGMMGGTGAHEYMAPCAAGENDVALSDAGYSANVEIASATPQPVEGLPAPASAPERVETPGATTVQAVADTLGAPDGRDHQGAARDRRGARAAARPRARRPPPQRVQAPQHARDRLPARRGGRGARAVRHRARLHRADRVARARARRPRPRGPARARDRRERARHPPDRGRARARLHGRVGRRAERRAGRHVPVRRHRSGSSRPSRWATSSSWARATRSRSARATSTSREPSS